MLAGELVRAEESNTVELVHSRGGRENHRPISSGKTATLKKCFTLINFSSINVESGVMRSTCRSFFVKTTKSQ